MNKKDLQDLIRFERFLAAGDSNHGANAVGTRTRDPDGGFYAVKTVFQHLVGGFYAVNTHSGTSLGLPTP